MSGSFDIREGDGEHPSPSTPCVSVSQLSTPKTSQPKVLRTPQAIREYEEKDVDTPVENGDNDPNEAPSGLPDLPSQHTPSIFCSQYDELEPPAWKPPEEEEVEYTDAWNNIYNNQHHYLQPGFSHDDSTIGSSQTNNSFGNNVGIGAPNRLRPRGLSLCSYTDAGSTGSAPQLHQGRAQHRRHPSLPVSFFSSTQQGSQPLFQSELCAQHLPLTSPKQNLLNTLQSTTKNTYEIHSHHNVSQVQADAAMAGLSGALIDLYMVDRSVDSATARMMETKEDRRSTWSGGNGGGHACSQTTKHERSPRQKSHKSRKTSLGTLKDIQCILDLHKVDKLVDRFKQGLQMPQFFEEEAWVDDVWKDLRKTDLEMDEHAKKKKMNKSEAPQQGKGGVMHQYDLGENEGRWKNGPASPGEEIFLSSESLLGDYDAYQFFDPHETDGLQANAYQHSQALSASIHDDLNEIIDLLRTDTEVDGASRRCNEMDAIKPLLEVDLMMTRWKECMKLRDMWDEDLIALHSTDLEVDRAKRKRASKRSQSVQRDSAISSVKAHDSKPLSTSVDQEVKGMLSKHLPQASHQFCPTSPELMASQPSHRVPTLSLQSQAPSQLSSQLAIIPDQEKTSAVTSKPTTTHKRSIFSRQEKSSAANKCAYQRGVMMPGTTTIVMAKGGEVIDGIPVGKVVANHRAF